MKVVAAKTKKGLIGISSLLVVAFVLLPAASASAADTFPYFKEFGGDVAAGGGFDQGATNCVNPNYQSPYYQPSQYAGGILTYINGSGPNASGGSSSQYAAFADGSIDNTAGSAGVPSAGFYSDGAIKNSSIKALNFASIGAGWGGKFEGSTPNNDQCIPDYYGEKPSSLTNASSIETTTGDYQINLPPLTTLNSSTAIISGKQKINMYVNGSVYIDGDICYNACNGAPTAGTTYDPNNTPKFRLVVLGNIYIDPTVKQLDGWYIAQPSGSGTGIIWTCHNNSADYNAVETKNNCGQKQLVVNGALTAQRVNLNRTIGPGVAGADTNPDGPGTNTDGNAAEVFNYNPGMMLNGGFSTSSPNEPEVLNVTSLPPVF